MTTFARSIVEALKRNGFDVEVIFQEGVDKNNRKIVIPRIIFEIGSFFKINRTDILHIQDHILYLIPAYFYKKIFKCKVIFTFHTAPLNNKKYNHILKTFFQYLFNNCDCITFVSKSLHEQISKQYNIKFKKMCIISNGVAIDKCSEKEIAAFRIKYNIKPKSIILASLGLTSLKYKSDGLKLTILALKRIIRKYPNVVLIATKDGEYLEDLVKFTLENNMMNYVIFTRYIKNAIIPLQICDIYIHTPLNEGFGISILEAMYFGKIVIATSVGGIPEFVIANENGFLVDPQIDRIANMIEYVIDNLYSLEKIKINAENTAKKYSWDNIINYYINIYIKNI